MRGPVLVRCCLLGLLLLLPAGARAQYAVGTSDVTFRDPDRSERPVPADLYYPATVAGEDAPPAVPVGDGFAAVALGHGYQLAPARYAWIAERLASIGCVVAVSRTETGLFPSHAAFGEDLAFLVQALRAADSDAGSAFFGIIGPRAALLGHSMGGGCAFLGADGDPSIQAVITFAAAETDPSAIEACGRLSRPVLIFAANDDCVTPPDDHQIPMFQALAGGDRTYVGIDGAGHCQFAAYDFLCSLGEFCSPEITRDQQQDLVWSLLEPWARAILLEDAAARDAFQQRLEAQSGIVYEQRGTPTAAPSAGGHAALRLRAAPNPFNPSTVLQIDLAVPASPVVTLHDARGRRLRTWRLGRLEAGTHRIPFTGRADDGRPLPSGVYHVRCHTFSSEATTALVLVR
jgi:predicted dienelactone hydrolase